MKLNLLKIIIIAVFFSITGIVGGRSALAVPNLQVYIPGATYNTDEDVQTWITTSSSFDLWVIGALDKRTSRFRESDGTYTENIIRNVTLAVAFTGVGGTITFTPKTTGLTPDPSTPSDPGVAVWGSGINQPLKTHSIYPATWANYSLGDFTLQDSPVGDFANSGTGYAFPTYPIDFVNNGQINVYSVSVTGWERVHFDVFAPLSYDAVPTDGPSAYHIAPYSHDGGYANVVPEPGTFILLGGGLLGVAFLRKRLKKD